MRPIQTKSRAQSQPRAARPDGHSGARMEEAREAGMETWALLVVGTDNCCSQIKPGGYCPHKSTGHSTDVNKRMGHVTLMPSHWWDRPENDPQRRSWWMRNVTSGSGHSGTPSREDHSPTSTGRNTSGAPGLNAQGERDSLVEEGHERDRGRTTADEEEERMSQDVRCQRST